MIPAMKRRKIILSAISVCLLLAAGAIGYVMYMPHRNISREKPIVVDAAELVGEYRKDEAAADRRFLDKVLQVTGTVESSETDSDGQTVITLSVADTLSDVRCTLQNDAVAEPGQAVTLKGRCTGFLSDVILIDCFIIE